MSVPASGTELDDTALGGVSGSYRHGAALIASDRDLLDVSLPFLEAGLSAGDLTVLSCTDERAEILQGELGTRLRGVELDRGLSLLGSRPPDAFTHARQYAHRAAQGGSGRLRVLVEVSPAGDERGQREQMRFEAAANHIMAELSVTSLCLYDSRRLPADLLASARHTHPSLVTGGTWTASGAFHDPATYLRHLPRPRTSAENERPVVSVVDAPSLPELRHRLTGVLPGFVSDEEQLEDVRLGISEVAANAFRHGKRPVSGRIWADGRQLVCEVSDSGTTFDDPLAGFIPAHGFDLGRGGMGLWLARKLFDHVDLLPGPTGFTVRLSTTIR